MEFIFSQFVDVSGILIFVVIKIHGSVEVFLHSFAAVETGESSLFPLDMLG